MCWSKDDTQRNVLLSVLLMLFNYVFKYKVMIIKSNVGAPVNFTFTNFF